MRRLTFPGFLNQYVRALAGVDRLSLRDLVRRTGTDARLTEPLLVWAAVTGKADRLSRLLDDRGDLRTELAHLARLSDSGELEDALSTGDTVRPEYSKVWRSYVARRDASARDARLKLEARKRVLELCQQKQVSHYRLAKDLGLNQGNLHAYLVKENPSKFSLDRVADMLDYLQAA